MFNRQIWSIKKCPDCHCACYEFTWDNPNEVYSICACGVKRLISHKPQIVSSEKRSKTK